MLRTGRMRGLVAALAVLTAWGAAPAPPARAHHDDIVVSATVAVAAPTTPHAPGMTERSAPCDPSSPAQGVDGWWVEIPAHAWSAPAELTADAPNDFDLWFYDETCTRLDDRHMVGDGDERGSVTHPARWALVSLFSGAAAEFTLTIRTTSIDWPQAAPAVAGGGREGAGLVVWEDGRPPFHAARQAFGALVEVDEAVDGEGTRLSPGSGWHSTPALATAVDGWLAAWVHADAGTLAVEISHVHGTGPAAPPVRYPAADGESLLGPAAASDGRSSLVGWSTRQASPSGGELARVRGVRVGDDGAAIDSQPLELAAVKAEGATAGGVAIGWGGGVYLVAWKEHRCSMSAGEYLCEADVRAVRVAPHGAVLDADSRVLGTLDWSHHEFDPLDPVSVAWDGTRFLVAWDDDGQVWTSAVEGDGDAAQAMAVAAGTEPTVASDGAAARILTWRDSVHADGRRPLVVTALDEQGRPAAPSAQVAAAGLTPSAAWMGGHFLLTYQSLDGSGGADISAARVGADAAVLDPGGFVINDY